MISTRQPNNLRKRANKPKVRSGCIRCKLRRVKCDERKPTCFRCEKAGIPCEGYEKPQSKPPVIARAPKFILPHRSVQETTIPLPKPQLPSNGVSCDEQPHLLRPNPASAYFTEEDVVYFDLFRHQVVGELSGYLYSDFWFRIVLCESTRDECVRQAILGIGALSQALYASHSLVDRATGLSTLPIQPCARNLLNQHHKAAIYHHTKAIALWRERLQVEREGYSDRTALIITLLLVTFELLQGNMKAADGLMASGIMLLKNAIATLRDTRIHHKPGLRHGRRNTLDEHTEDIAHMLPSLSVMSGYTHFCNSQHDLYSFLRVSTGGKLPEPGLTSIHSALVLWGDFYTRNMIFVVQALKNHPSSSPYDRVKAKRDQHEFLEHLQRWRTILNSYAATETKDDRFGKALRLVQIHHLMCAVFTHCCLDETEMAYDAFEEEFRQMLERCTDFLANAGSVPKIHFTFGGGNLAPPLSLVAGKCRNREVRMQALEALNKLSWREGAWDTATHVIGKFGQIMLEEYGRDETGIIPSTSRWLWTGAHWNLDRRQVVAEYTRVGLDDGGVPVQTRLTLDIDCWPARFRGLGSMF